MVKQNLFTVKQPELGQRIQELRKAKGLTQEELVGRCNINVRTIQRIEAGEVTPRTFTVKTILEALGYDLNAIQFQESEETTPLQASPSHPFLKTAFFLGVFYFVLGFIEGFLDMSIWGMGFPIVTFHDIIPFFGYVAIKAIVLITFGGFMMGFYQLATLYPNSIVQTAALVLTGLEFVFVSIDIYSFYTQKANEFFLPVEAISFGIVYVVFSIGIIKYRRTFGEIAFYAGLMGMISGVLFMTFVMAFLGLTSLAVFEILLLVLLFRVSDNNKITAGPIPVS